MSLTFIPRHAPSNLYHSVILKMFNINQQNLTTGVQGVFLYFLSYYIIFITHPDASNIFKNIFKYSYKSYTRLCTHCLFQFSGLYFTSKPEQTVVYIYPCNPSIIFYKFHNSHECEWVMKYFIVQD